MSATAASRSGPRARSWSSGSRATSGSRSSPTRGVPGGSRSSGRAGGDVRPVRKSTRGTPPGRGLGLATAWRPVSGTSCAPLITGARIPGGAEIAPRRGAQWTGAASATGRGLSHDPLRMATHPGLGGHLTTSLSAVHDVRRPAGQWRPSGPRPDRVIGLAKGILRSGRRDSNPRPQAWERRTRVSAGGTRGHETASSRGFDCRLLPSPTSPYRPICTANVRRMLGVTGRRRSQEGRLRARPG